MSSPQVVATVASASSSQQPLLGASFSENEAERYQQIRDLVVSCVPFLSAIEPTEANLVVKVLCGGITNQLFVVSAPSLTASSPSVTTECTHSVVVRVFGKETDKIISRDSEQFWQSKFLKTFGRFESALVYEYLEGFRPLDYPEMSAPAYTPHIARELARFHDRATRVHTFASKHHGPNFLQVFVSKWVPMVLDREEVTKRVVEVKKDEEGFEAFKSLGWLEDTPLGPGTVVTVLEKELAELGQIMACFSDELPTGICHNDLLCGNVMVKDGGAADKSSAAQQIRLIDFEYAQSNYIYYDIANHICEWAGFECEYEKYFPTKDGVKAFLREYYAEAARLVDGLETSEADLDRAADLVLFFTLYSHLVWAVWAVIQGMFSAIDFPYLPYSTLRWAQYLRTKEKFIYALV